MNRLNISGEKMEIIAGNYIYVLVLALIILGIYFIVKN